MIIPYLSGDGVGFADLVAPEAAPDRDDGKLGEDDSAPDGGGHLLAALHAQAHVTVVVANGWEKRKQMIIII
jgi:hypothetical protein